MQSHHGEGGTLKRGCLGNGERMRSNKMTMMFRELGRDAWKQLEEFECLAGLPTHCVFCTDFTSMNFVDLVSYHVNNLLNVNGVGLYMNGSRC